LLRNVFWWYLLPFAIAILAFFGQVSWQMAIETNEWLPALGFGTFLSAFIFALYYWIYYINQRAVRTQLEPRRQELLALQASLSEDNSSEVSGESPILLSEQPLKCPLSRRRLVFALVCFVAILYFVVPGILYVAQRVDQYLNQDDTKRAPFAAVRWQDAQPEVQIDDEWFKLVSLNDLPADDIVAFSQKINGSLWKKRFEEDLVKLLTGMGHPPRDTVKLVLESLTSPPEKRVREDVPMTSANRRAIRDAAQARERDEQPPAA
jgi:hypothetical protein